MFQWRALQLAFFANVLRNVFVISQSYYCFDTKNEFNVHIPIHAKRVNAGEEKFKLERKIKHKKRFTILSL